MISSFFRRLFEIIKDMPILSCFIVVVITTACYIIATRPEPVTKTDLTVIAEEWAEAHDYDPAMITCVDHRRNWGYCDVGGGQQKPVLLRCTRDWCHISVDGY